LYLGWAAVVANLEDITSAFRTRAEMFEQNFLQHLGSRDQFTQLLAKYVIWDKLCQINY
jgi:RB1-inducible coiled-coil protein 1